MWLLFGREAWIAHDSKLRWILCLTGKIRLKLLPDERCVRDSMKHQKKVQKVIVSKLFSTAMYFDMMSTSKRQLFVAFARCEGGRLAPLCPFREPMGIFDEAPSLPWQLFEGKGWEVCASFTWSLQKTVACLYTSNLYIRVTSFYWRVSKVCLSWSVGQAGRPLFTVCEHYLSDVDLFATELLQRLGSALQSRSEGFPISSSRWFHLVSHF